MALEQPTEIEEAAFAALSLERSLADTDHATMTCNLF